MKGRQDRTEKWGWKEVKDLQFSLLVKKSIVSLFQRKVWTVRQVESKVENLGRKEVRVRRPKLRPVDREMIGYEVTDGRIDTFSIEIALSRPMIDIHLLLRDLEVAIASTNQMGSARIYTPIDLNECFGWTDGE